MEDDGPPGVPEWVVTYGDMMSLLLTFFIMLVSLSEVVADKKYRSILQHLKSHLGYHASPLAPPGDNFPLNSMMGLLSKTAGSSVDDDDGRGGVKVHAIEGTDLRVFRTREGALRQVSTPIFFAVGEADLTDEGEATLRQVVEEAAGKPNKLDIRAHASPGELPPNSPFKKKNKYWLCYERARNVQLFLEQAGIDHNRFRVTAVGDIEPPEQSGDKRSLRHDRVEISLSDAFKSEYVGPRDGR